MVPPIEEPQLTAPGPRCDLKLKPPRIPAKSKKIYKGLFKRSQKPFTALYDVETGIYVVSIHNSREVDVWIDKNYDEIQRRLKCL